MNADTQTHPGTAADPAPSPAAAAASTVATVTMDDLLARLELSRSRLRASFAPPAPAAQADGRRSFHPWRRARAWLRGTPWGGLLDPVVSALGHEVQQWWQRQTWRQSAELVKDAVADNVLPLVRRHPMAALLVTAAAGAALAGSGVWRWRTVRRSASHLARQVRHVCLGQLASPALQSLLLAALLSLLAPKRERQPKAEPSATNGPRTEPVEPGAQPAPS